MKVTVRIHKSTGLELKKKKIESDGRVTLIKDSRKKAEWRPLIKQLEPKHKWLGRTDFYADIWPKAEETWTYDGTLSPDKQPKWDKDRSKAYIGKKILDKAGEEMKDKASGMGIWIIAILVIVGIALNFLLSSGRLRL